MAAINGIQSESHSAKEAWASYRGTLDKLRMALNYAKLEYGCFDDEVAKELDAILSEETGDGEPMEVLDSVMRLLEVLIIPAAELILEQRRQLDAASESLQAKEGQLTRVASMKGNLVKEMEVMVMAVESVQRALQEVSEERRRVALRADSLYQERIDLLTCLLTEGPPAAAKWVEAQFRQHGKAPPPEWERMWKSFAAGSDSAGDVGGAKLDDGGSETGRMVRDLVFEDKVKDAAEQRSAAQRRFEDGQSESREWPPGATAPPDATTSEMLLSRRSPPGSAQKACVSWEGPAAAPLGSSMPTGAQVALVQQKGQNSGKTLKESGTTLDKAMSAVLEETLAAAAVVQSKGVFGTPEAVLGFYVRLGARLMLFAATTTLTCVKRSSVGFAFQYI